MNTELNKPWKTDIKNWTLVSKETAALMISQSESLLKETIETSKTITNKSEKLLSFQVPGALACLLYFFNNMNGGLTLLLLTSILAFLVIGVSLYFSYQSFKKYDINVTGEYPKNIANSLYIDEHPDAHQQYINMTLSVCENIQNRIDANRPLNEERLTSNQYALKILVTVVLSPLAAQSLLWLIQLVHFLLP